MQRSQKNASNFKQPAARVAATVLSASLALTGCFERNIRAIEPCTRARFAQQQSLATVDTVDLLFMIDNSGSMKDERAAIATELPRLVSVLTTGNTDADPEPEFQGVRSLHVGVITSDMGAGSTAIQGCNVAGDDATLQVRGLDSVPATSPACTANYPSGVFQFNAGDNAAEFGSRVACVVRGVEVSRPPNGGCGLEQQLEAVLKALSPESATTWTRDGYVAPQFFQGTGKAGNNGENAGFVRDGSALAVVVVSDEEDSSTTQPDIAFSNPSGTACGGPNDWCVQTSNGLKAVGANIRSSFFPNGTPGREDAFTDISRYAQGLLALRRSSKLLVYAAIVGVPTSQELADRSYEAMLQAPAMAYVPCATFATLTQVCGVSPAEACTSGGATGATPGRRFVELARQLDSAGAGTAVESICQTGNDGKPNYQGAIDVLIAKIAGALSASCIPRAQNPDAQGLVNCDVIETLPEPGDVCGAGREPAGIQRLNDGTELQRCRLNQLPIGQREASNIGWFYDNSAQAAAECGGRAQRLKLTASTEVRNGTIAFECLQTVVPGDSAPVRLGSFCDPASGAVVGADNMTCANGSAPSGTAANPKPLSCDPVLRSCGVGCTDTSQCEGAGLQGYVCDTRAKMDVIGGTDSSPYNFCVNPICN